MIADLYQIFKKSTGVNTDTRTLTAGQLYIALKGDNFDGNDYVEQALKKGASHVISSDVKWKENEDVTVVTDSLITLQELSTYHRKRLSIPILALTGSNGKTTTKELIIAVLQTQFDVLGTIGNLNNHIGVPLTLLSFNSDTEIGVVEMGANHQKEIEFLCSIAQPDYGLITNFGKAHLEGFGGVEGVIKGKSEMYDYLSKVSGTAIVARWDEKQLEKSEKLKRILTIENPVLNGVDPYVNFGFDGIDIQSQITGSYNYNNMLFAATIGKVFGISLSNIKKGIESYLPSNNRSQIIHRLDSTIILDAYNANPSSMEVALKNLKNQKHSRKIAILGDMFELGAAAQEEHQYIADLANSLKLNQVLLIGKNFFNTETEAKKYLSYEDFSNDFTMLNDKNTVYLIKGSRGMKLERIVEKKNN